MKNFELNNFRAKPVCDVHVHSHVNATLEETIEIFKNVMEYFNYEKMVLESLPWKERDIINNFKNLYFKSKIDGVYASMGLRHNFDERDTEDFYLEQAQAYYKMGCDGFKMLDGKPLFRKMINKPLDHKSFDKFYGFAEEKGLPILMHVGDPREFWDPERVSEHAKKRGWYYGEGDYTSFETLQKEIEGILEKFPKLKLVLAHFFFVSDDIKYADWFLSKWENVCFDLTPGAVMYDNFSNNIVEWRKFFEKHSDRFLFGTDVYNWKQGERTLEEVYSHQGNRVRWCLEKNEPYWDNIRNKKIENTFGFDDAMLDKIYHDNFIRVFGANSRELDREYIVAEGERFLANNTLNESQTSDLKQIIDWFK